MALILCWIFQMLKIARKRQAAANFDMSKFKTWIIIVNFNCSYNPYIVHMYITIFYIYIYMFCVILKFIFSLRTDTMGTSILAEVPKSLGLVWSAYTKFKFLWWVFLYSIVYLVIIELNNVQILYFQEREIMIDFFWLQSKNLAHFYFLIMSQIWEKYSQLSWYMWT